MDQLDVINIMVASMVLTVCVLAWSRTWWVWPDKHTVSDPIMIHCE